MSISATTLLDLAALSLSTEQMQGVLMILARSEQAEENRKERDRNRKRQGKSKDAPGNIHGNSMEIPGKDRGISDLGFPDKETSPAPPKETNPSPSLRSGFVEARASDAEFAEFWVTYPHKVGKPAGLRAFNAARRRADFETIVEGLRRYIRTKPPDRPWLNPATFLNQDRFSDEPAKLSQKINGHNRPEPGHDTIFRALAARAARGGGFGERQANPDDGVQSEFHGADEN